MIAFDQWLNFNRNWMGFKADVDVVKFNIDLRNQKSCPNARAAPLFKGLG